MSAVWSRYSKSKPGTAWVRRDEEEGADVEGGLLLSPLPLPPAATSLSIPSSSSSFSLSSSSLALLALAPSRGPRGVTAAASAGALWSLEGGGRSAEEALTFPLVVGGAGAISSSSRWPVVPPSFSSFSTVADSLCRLEARGGLCGRDSYCRVVIPFFVFVFFFVEI